MSKRKNNNVIFGIFLIMLCLLVMVLSVVMRQLENDFYSNCKTTQGTVEKIENKSLYVSYNINGEEYNSVLLWGQVHNVVVGSKIEIYYNPYNYSEIGVYQEHNILSEVIAIFILIILVILGILFIIFNSKRVSK